ncbi:MAG: M50 family metallopeptidase [Patescibacteria group bacterium]
MNLGILIILITTLGYFSNWLNWRYLNYPIVRFLYYFGAAIHELSHAIFCMIAGARITEFSIFSKQPHVTSLKPKLPIVGQFLISLAPIVGGLAFLFLLNKYFLEGYFVMPQILSPADLLLAPLDLLSQINLLSWQSWLMIFLFLNTGAMIGPSFSDLKNIWPLIVASFFVKWPLLFGLGLLVAALILTNILLQIIFLLAILVAKKKPILAAFF